MMVLFYWESTKYIKCPSKRDQDWKPGDRVMDLSALLCDHMIFGRAQDTACWLSDQYSLPTSFSPETSPQL